MASVRTQHHSVRLCDLFRVGPRLRKRTHRFRKPPGIKIPGARRLQSRADLLRAPPLLVLYQHPHQWRQHPRTLVVQSSARPFLLG